MTKRSENLLIDDDERRFIDSLFAINQEALDELPQEEMQLTIPAQAPQLEQLLQRADSLRLELRLRNYTLHFHPHLEQDTVSGLCWLRLGYPDIIEHYGTARSLRLDIDATEMQVVDISGRLSHLSVANISATGAALIADNTEPGMTPGTTRLRLSINFPDASSFTVEGMLVRQDDLHADRQRLALKFTRIPPQMKERINAFIYQHTLAPTAASGT